MKYLIVAIVIIYFIAKGIMWLYEELRGPKLGGSSAGKINADKIVNKTKDVQKSEQEKEREQKKRIEENRERVKKEEEQRNKARKELFNRNKDLIEKLLQIAERKVSIIDDYGDENWEILPTEIFACLKKIAQRENKSISFNKRYKYGTYEYEWLGERLEDAFRSYHSEQKTRPLTSFNTSKLTGAEFESWIVKLLKENGFDDVRGTPATGDQGADIIAVKNGKHIIIQAKRYKGSVGNKAVQEVIAALQYYNGDEGWVITDSSFTPSAIALAQKSNIILIDGKTLTQDFIHNKIDKNVIDEIEEKQKKEKTNNDHVIFQCHSCNQKMRVPIRNNLIEVSCPKCKNIFYFHNGKETQNV